MPRRDPDPRRWIGRGAALLAGTALVVAFPAPSWWWWAYVGLVPVLLLVRAAEDRREAIWRSWLAASGFFGALHHWLFPYLSVFTVPVVAAVGVVWVPWGLAAWALLRPPVRAPRVAAALVVLPSVWLVVEYARSWERLGGTWGLLGLTQWNVPLVLSVAAVGGVWALSALLVVSNVAVTVAVAPDASRSARVGALSLAVLLVAAAVGYGGLRTAPDVTGHLRVGAVQAGVVDDTTARLDGHVELTRELVADDPDVDVVVWGQSSVGFDLDRSPDVRRRLIDLAAEIDRQLVVNVDARLPSGRIAKTAVVVEPDGLGDTYRKQRLVPFGEYVPLRPVFGWVEDLTQAANEDRLPGTDLTAFDLADTTVGPLISYESTFPDMRRTLAGDGVSMTLVQAAATSFQGSWALPQQASFEAVRAVESGRPSVFVAVSGTSSSFDHRGDRLAWVPQSDVTGWAVDVPLSAERTPFVRWGPFVPMTAIVVTVVAALVGLALWWRRQSDSHSSSSRPFVSGSRKNSPPTAPAAGKRASAAPPNSS